MNPFEICEPRSLMEAIALLDPEDLSSAAGAVGGVYRVS